MFRKFKISNRLPNRYFSENCRWAPLICERFEPRTHFIGSLSRIVRVNAVLNNTVVESDCAVVILKLSPAVSYIRLYLHHVRVILRTHRPSLSWLETSLPVSQRLIWIRESRSSLSEYFSGFLLAAAYIAYITATIFIFYHYWKDINTLTSGWFDVLLVTGSTSPVP